MKPSKFITVKGRKAWFLLPGFSALTWKGYAYCKTQKEADKINSTDKIDSRLESHETIHIRQAESTHDSWFLFYTRYVWAYICNLPLIFINVYAPYKFMPFEIEAYFSVPKSASKKKRAAMLTGDIRPTKKPDMDNILKTVADALNGIAYRDDSQIVRAIVDKYYDTAPRLIVTITALLSARWYVPQKSYS